MCSTADHRGGRGRPDHVGPAEFCRRVQISERANDILRAAWFSLESVLQTSSSSTSLTERPERRPFTD
jgi:hypothetical protein